MSELKFINENLDINVGDVFKHKADDRKMVVIDFHRSSNYADPNVRDKTHQFADFTTILKINTKYKHSFMRN